MIPKTVHQIWLGEKEIPPALIAWAWSFRSVQPDWELRLWADRPDSFCGADMPWSTVSLAPSLVMEHLLTKLEPYHNETFLLVARSDIMRYEIIAEHGGVYADLDVELFQPMDDFTENIRLWGADEHQRMVCNAIFGAEKNHPAMHRLVSGLEHHIHTETTKLEKKTRAQEDLVPVPRGTMTRSLNPVITTGPIYFMRTMTKEHDFVRFPWPRFHAVPGDIDAEKIVGWPDTTYGHHHLAGTWYSRRKRDPSPELMGVDGCR